MKFRVVESLREYYFDKGHFSKFMEEKGLECENFFFFKKRSGGMFKSKKRILLEIFVCFSMLVWNARGFRNRKVVCLGGHHSMFLFARLFRIFLGPDFHLFIYNYYLHHLGTRKSVQFLIRSMLNTNYTTIIVQSPDEMRYFSSMSKNPVHFIPYCEQPDFSMNDNITVDGHYLFSGGYTNRDYSLILKCAKANPGIKFVLAVSKSNRDIMNKKLPDNLIIFEEIDSASFNGLMYRSLGVIVPLKEDVGASGQMLCLGAMKMSKPIIYCDISSINYYFANADCGIPYTLGDLDSLNASAKKLMSGEVDTKLMGERAHKQFSLNFTIGVRNEKLLDLILKQQEPHTNTVAEDQKIKSFQ